MKDVTPLNRSMDQDVAKINLTRVGILLGATFPVIAFVSDVLWSDLGISIDTVFLLYGRGPLHWIILTAPLILGFVFHYFSGVVNSRIKIVQEEQNKSRDESIVLESFISDLEKGEFENKDYGFSNTHLAGLLLSLKAKLLHQKDQDEKAKWTAEGLAKFGELFRMTDDLAKLSDEIIKNLVVYVGLNQGSVFICETEANTENVLVLKACYAYDRKKYFTKTIHAGEGLVGQCYLENETIVLKKVPHDYVKISSGLGGSTPGFVVIVPIKTTDSREGVLELAGFRPLQDHQIHFIQKVCEGFASVIQATKGNEKTRQLLKESQHQSEQLRQQEEEIRQNLEEMQATQEQLTRQLEESKMLKDRVERREQVMALTTILSETDLHGHITFVNDKFCEVAKYRKEELLGKPHNIVRHSDMPKELFKLFWETIQQGKVFNGIVKNKAKDGSHYWVDATIVPIKNEEGKILKFVGSRYHIKEEELAVALYNKQAAHFNWPRL